jgi:hypothetical protein
VATDAEYARRAAAHDYAIYAPDMCDYEGGYADGKVIDLAFLRDVAAQGSEPARAAFVGAILAYARLPELGDLLAEIVTYPEAAHSAKIQSFFAQVQAWQWYVGEAEKRDNRYLLLHTTAQLVLFGGRMILAHNRVLYPYHKWFMTAVERAPEKPDQCMALIDRLLHEPSKAHADAFCEALFAFTAWDQPPEGWPARFMQDTEWAWRTGHVPLPDC